MPCKRDLLTKFVFIWIYHIFVNRFLASYYNLLSRFSRLKNQTRSPFFAKFKAFEPYFSWKLRKLINAVKFVSRLFCEI